MTPSTSHQTEDAFCIFKEAKEVPTMPVAKEFTVLMEDRPSTLGKVCRALADREVNILAAGARRPDCDHAREALLPNPLETRAAKATGAS
jgi:hypothetical protein